jgi:hypothetical protein
MRFGPLEIVIIAIVILIIFGATRIKQVSNKLGGGGGDRSSSGRSAPAKQSPPVRYPRLQALGILILIGGAIVLGLSFIIDEAILTWAIGGGIIVFLGVALIIISRRR